MSWCFFEYLHDINHQRLISILYHFLVIKDGLMIQVNTVLGKIDSDRLGITSPHEHIFVDITAYYKKPNNAQLKKYSLEVVNLKNLGFIRRNVFKVRDNLILNDPDVSIEELLEYKKAGGSGLLRAPETGPSFQP